MRAFVMLQTGRALLRCRRNEGARRAFRDVLQRRGDEIRAYLYLGRIALIEGDFSAARRELASARRADPARFERLLPAIVDARITPRSTDWPDFGEKDGFSTPGSVPTDTGPFTRKGPAGANRADASPAGTPTPPAWFWYFDASGQGSPPRGPSAAWSPNDRESTRPDDWPDFEDNALWDRLRQSIDDHDRTDTGRPLDAIGDVWSGEWPADSSAEDGWSSDNEIDATWHEDGDSYEEFDGQAFDETDDGDDEGSDLDDDDPDVETWQESPLASFYEELARAGWKRAHRSSDFSSEAEERRFRDLPPIVRQDIENIDWDWLKSELESDTDL